MNFLVFLVSLLTVLHLTIAAKILLAFPSNSRSQYEFNHVFLYELASRGHQLTLISPIKPVREHENITLIKIDGVREHFIEMGYEKNYNFDRKDLTIIPSVVNLLYKNAVLADFILGQQVVVDLLKSDQKFDLFISDFQFTDCLLGLAHYYQIPSVVISAMGTNKWTNEMVGNPHNPAYNPSTFLGYSNQMSFIQRIWNTLASTFEKITYNFMYLPNQEAIYKRHFEPIVGELRELPPLIDVIHNVSLVLINSHPALDFPRPYVPNMIQIGGAHIPKSQSELVEQIYKVLNEAKNGVIYMSLGGNIQSADLPEEKLSVFTDIFNHMNGFNVIWKWEKALLNNHTNNIVIGPWLPQRQVLAYDNTKLFISQGGTLSFIEAVNAGVPIIVMPIYGEQEYVAALVEYTGVGRRIDYGTLSVESLNATVHDVLNNPIYKENILKLRELLNKNQMHPLDTALYHIDHVLATNGSHYLRSPSIEYSFLREYLLDVSTVIFLGIVIIVAIPFLIICTVLRKTDPQRKKSVNSKQGKPTRNLNNTKTKLPTENLKKRQ